MPTATHRDTAADAAVQPSDNSPRAESDKTSDSDTVEAEMLFSGAFCGSIGHIHASLH